MTTMASPFPFHLLLLLLLIFPLSESTVFHITNKCSHTIWPACVPHGGGEALVPSGTWTVVANSATATSGAIWARTNCSFDASSGRGTCVSGDCSGALRCASPASSPATVIPYALNQWGGEDFYGITLVRGFNLPVEITPLGPASCRPVRCAADIATSCPRELRSPAGGGCRGPCAVFGSDQYCCNRPGSCLPNNYSKFFKALCPNACSYPLDVPTSTFTCPSGHDYRVTFCP